MKCQIFITEGNHFEGRRLCEITEDLHSEIMIQFLYCSVNCKLCYLQTLPDPQLQREIQLYEKLFPVKCRNLHFNSFHKFEVAGAV